MDVNGTQSVLKMCKDCQGSSRCKSMPHYFCTRHTLSQTSIAPETPRLEDEFLFGTSIPLGLEAPGPKTHTPGQVFGKPTRLWKAGNGAFHGNN